MISIKIMATNRIEPPTACAIWYGPHAAVSALPAYSEYAERRGPPSNPCQCIATDIIVIPTVQNIVCTTANLLMPLVSVRPLLEGLIQHAMPKNVRIPVIATAIWKWPVTHMVL